MSTEVTAREMPPGPPRGVHRAGHAQPWWNVFPDIPVRCRKQPPDEAPRYARRRFGGDVRELSGAFGDLGTFIPHIVGAITVVGMAPSGMFLSFGLFYLFSGAFYGLPIPVQPMKAASAVVLTQHLPPAAIAGAGLTVGALLLFLGSTGIITRLARMLPDTVAAGLQLGLGLALALLGINLAMTTPWLGGLICLFLLAFLGSRRWPGALLALATGIVLGQVSGVSPPIPSLTFGIHLPDLVIPTWSELWQGFIAATVPQLPLTLTNAVIVTAALTRQLFPREVHRVNETTLCLTSGFANLLAAPFGGYPMCHGAGGLAAHHRFGARTATAPAVIGILMVLIGVFCGDQALALVRVVPEAALGALLLFSGIDLAQAAKPQRFERNELFVVLLMAAISIALNPAAAFVIGLPLAVLARKGWLNL
jgi:predicted benzoate:H+ symporter BenE